jgi:hypothetical protein
MPKQQEITDYDSIGKKLFGLDSSIISVTISSFAGEILNMKCAPVAEPLKPSDSLLEKAGSLLAMVTAIVNQGEAPYGKCKYVVIAYGKIKVVIIPVRSKQFVVALGIVPEAPSREISLKVSALLENM